LPPTSSLHYDHSSSGILFFNPDRIRAGEDTLLRIAMAFAVLLWAASAESKTWSILPDGTGDAPTIAAGLDSAAAHDSVVVACGTYFEYGLTLKSGIVLCSESGEPECVRIDAGGLGRVLTAIDVSLTRIEGLTIESGQGLPGNLNGGGGLHCLDSQFTIKNCVFAQNTSPFGGGIGCYSSSLSITECRFEGNSAEAVAWAAGGGIFCKESTPLLQDCIFTLNTAFSQDLPGDGGGIFSQAGYLEATDCTFVSNSSGAGGGGMYSFLVDQPVLTRCTFTENSSGSGGGMYLETSYATMTDCNFDHNTAPTGGAMLIAKWSYPFVTRCTFDQNHAETLSGGAMSLWHSGPLIQECIFRDNTAGLDGGAIFAGGNSSPTLEDSRLIRNVAANQGSAIRCYFTTRVDVLRSTIVGSDSPGGAIFTELSGPTTLTRTILAWGTSGAAVVCGDASVVTLNCCDLYGNAGGDWTGCIAAQSGQNGNFSLDPLLCNLLQSDLALEPSSPCAPENSGGCGLVGAVGVGCSAVSVGLDMPLESWGRIKGHYRLESPARPQSSK
jgi:predicted outer membrane repeat protein